MDNMDDIIPLTIKKTGTLSINNFQGKKVPHYVIDYIVKPYEDPYYVVYKTKVIGSHYYPIKDYEEKEYKAKKQDYKGNTALVEIARKVEEKREEAERARIASDPSYKPTPIPNPVIRIPKPPLYMAVQTYGVDSFSGKRAKGFYERTPDKMIGSRFEPGEPTGIFVNDEIINWEEPKVNLGEIADNASL